MRSNWDGTCTTLGFDALCARSGIQAPLNLLQIFNFIAHQHRNFPLFNAPSIIKLPTLNASVQHHPNLSNLTQWQREVIDKKLVHNFDSNEKRNHSFLSFEDDFNLYLRPGCAYLPSNFSPYRRLTSPSLSMRNKVLVQSLTLFHWILSRTLGTKITNRQYLCLMEPFYKNLHLLARIKGHTQEVFFVMFDHSGNRIITGSDDWLIKIWSAHTGILIQTLRGHKQIITGIAIDATNQLLASSSEDKTIRIWCLKTLAPITVLQIGDTKAVGFLAWSSSPQHPVLIYAASDRLLKVWEVVPTNFDHIQSNPNTVPIYGNGTNFNEYPSIPCPSNFECASISYGGVRAATGSKDGIVRIWHIHPPTVIQELKPFGNAMEVSNVSWSHHDHRILSTTEDGTGRIWSFSNPESGWQLQHTLTASETQHIKPKVIVAIWSLDDQYVILSLKKPQHGAYLKVFNTKTGQLQYNLDEHTNCVYVLDIHPLNPNLFMSAGYDGKVVIWQLNTGKALVVFSLDKFEDEHSEIVDGRFCPNGTQLVVSDILGTISILGIDSSDSYRHAPKEQFFRTDYALTIADVTGFVLDLDTNQEPHLIPRGFLCNRYLHPYDLGPLPGNIEDKFPNDFDIQQHFQRQIQLAQIEQQLVSPYPNTPDSPPRPITRLQARQGCLRSSSNQLTTNSNSVRQLTLNVTHGNNVDSLIRTTRNSLSTGLSSSINTSPTSTSYNQISSPQLESSNDRLRPRSRLLSRLGLDPIHDHQLVQIIDNQDETEADIHSHPSIETIHSMDHEIDNHLDELADDDDDFIDLESDQSNDDSDPEHYPHHRSRIDETDDEHIDHPIDWIGESDDDSYNERRVRSTSERSHPSHSIHLSTSTNMVTRSRTRTRDLTSERTSVSTERSVRLERNGQTMVATRTRSSSISQPSHLYPNQYISNRPLRSTRFKSINRLNEGLTDHEDPSDSMRDPILSTPRPSQLSQDMSSSLMDQYLTNQIGSMEINSIPSQEVASYPSWITSTMTPFSYTPQLGDRIIYFRFGHDRYRHAFTEFDHFVPDCIPNIAYCQVTGLTIRNEPFFHCMIELTVPFPQPTLPHLKTSEPQVQSSTDNHIREGIRYINTPKTRSNSWIKTNQNDSKWDQEEGSCDKINQSWSSDEFDPCLDLNITPFNDQSINNPNGSISTSRDNNNPIHLLDNSSFPADGVKFQVYYHLSANEIPDFLVLTSRFSQSMDRAWYPGKSFQSWMYDSEQAGDGIGRWYSGTIIKVNTVRSTLYSHETVPSLTSDLVINPWECLTVLWPDEEEDPSEERDQSIIQDPDYHSWQDISKTSRVSPWEVEAIDFQTNHRQPIFIEAIDPQFASKMAESIEEIMLNHPNAMPFIDPVNLEDYPSYIQIVSTPIDLGTLVARLRSNYYRTFQQLEHEIKLLRTNSTLFNGDDNLITISAQRIVDELMNRLKKFKPKCQVMVAKMDQKEQIDLNVNPSRIRNERTQPQQRLRRDSIRRTTSYQRLRRDEGEERRKRNPYQDKSSQIVQERNLNNNHLRRTQYTHLNRKDDQASDEINNDLIPRRSAQVDQRSFQIHHLALRYPRRTLSQSGIHSEESGDDSLHSYRQKSRTYDTRSSRKRKLETTMSLSSLEEEEISITSKKKEESNHHFSLSNGIQTRSASKRIMTELMGEGISINNRSMESNQNKSRYLTRNKTRTFSNISNENSNTRSTITTRSKVYPLRRSSRLSLTSESTSNSIDEDNLDDHKEFESS